MGHGEPTSFRQSCEADSEANLVMRATNEIPSSQKTLLAMTLHFLREIPDKTT
jgi:hypothetical protein